MKEKTVGLRKIKG